ncbi:MAG: MBL fold metallo-hydrolase, partial [Nanoarchaeota archaeon]|nr:MBL fold metallo-hydrolase [Nanoarchaeota archaeon]
VKLDLIIPYKDGYSDKKEDNSIVVKMRYGDVSFLFMSDCTSACEDKLKGYDLKADILKIGDFGSNESTSDEFLDNVKPKVAIISTDMTECSFSLLDTVKKLEDRGIRVYRTDIYGTITVESDGKTFSLKTEKSPGEEGEGQQE